MLRALYNLGLCLLVLVYLPKWLWEAFRHKMHRRSFLEKFGFALSSFHTSYKGPRIWVHSISVGETKAAVPLILQLQKKHPDASIFISTITETGQEEAKKSIPEADTH